ncbi:MAG: LLM class F420-dependent oxidoreductase [Lysobacterales bacterium]|nr:MAG: LLM class F420-dependent oxidoreductase [Xanthomonadales bacterium]
MRFSFWPIARQSWEEVLALASHVERTGWDGIWYADHFMPNTPEASDPCHEVWTTVAGLAVSVPRIRIGTLVAGNTYRHPAVVANMAATIDHMSGGRLVLGLGAGWQENEHRAYGMEYYTVGERLRRLEEACQVIKALFNEQRANFEGRYYRLENAPMEPKPIQDPLPLMIGGGGEKVTLRITARYADEWNVWGDVDRLRQKMGVLDGHCETVGRDPGGIQRSAAVLVYLSDDPALVKRIREEPQARPSIAGNSAQLADIVAEYAQAGVDELIVPDFHMEPGTAKTEFLDHFIEEVAPAGR